MIENSLPTFQSTDINQLIEQNPEYRNRSRVVRAKEFGRFVLYRQSAWLEWIGGIAGGNILVEAGAPRSVVTAGVISAVFGAESLQAGIERRAIKDDTKENSDYTKTTLIKDVVGFGFAMWQGAASTATYNRANGLANTKLRNNVQSAAYAMAVGYWVSPLPYAEEGRDKAQDLATSAIDYALENPVGTGLGAVAFSAGLYGILSGIEKFRNSRTVDNNPQN